MYKEVPLRVLPAQPSLEYLRKEAKRELGDLRSRAHSAQLSDAQLLVARTYGFPSWRALKLEVDSRRESLGLMPALALADLRPRRLARAYPWVPDPEQVATGSCLVGVSIFSIPAVPAIAALLLALLH